MLRELLRRIGAWMSDRRVERMKRLRAKPGRDWIRKDRPTFEGRRA